MSRITVKHGDKKPITFTINMDLTGATVRLICSRSGVTTELHSTITNAAGGVVEHVLDGTLAVGTYDVELEVTQGSTLVTAPTAGFTRLAVTRDLD